MSFSPSKTIHEADFLRLQQEVWWWMTGHGVQWSWGSATPKYTLIHVVIQHQIAKL